jgi:hypothetical protein
VDGWLAAFGSAGVLIDHLAMIEEEERDDDGLNIAAGKTTKAEADATRMHRVNEDVARQIGAI